MWNKYDIDLLSTIEIEIDIYTRVSRARVLYSYKLQRGVRNIVDPVRKKGDLSR